MVSACGVVLHALVPRTQAAEDTAEKQIDLKKVADKTILKSKFTIVKPKVTPYMSFPLHWEHFVTSAVSSIQSNE